MSWIIGSLQKHRGFRQSSFIKEKSINGKPRWDTLWFFDEGIEDCFWYRYLIFQYFAILYQSQFKKDPIVSQRGFHSVAFGPKLWKPDVVQTSLLKEARRWIICSQQTHRGFRWSSFIKDKLINGKPRWDTQQLFDGGIEDYFWYHYLIFKNSAIHYQTSIQKEPTVSQRGFHSVAFGPKHETPL